MNTQNSKAKVADVVATELLIIRDEIEEAQAQKRPISLEPMEEWKRRVAQMVAEAKGADND